MYYDSNLIRFCRSTDYILTTPAVSTPISLEEVKEHIKSVQGFDDYDSQLLDLINIVTEYGEKVTGRDFINKTYKAYLDCFPSCAWQSIQLRKSKLQSITSIQYLKDNVLTTFSSSNYYSTLSNNFSDIHLVDGQSWPSDEDNRKQAVVITFVSGYGDDSCDIPPTLKQAMLSHVATLFENSGDCADISDSNSQFLSLYKPFILPSKRFCVV